MKISHFLLTILGATTIIIIIVLNCDSRKFRWEPTYDPNDRQPYGAMAFDSIMHASIKKGYEVMEVPADSIAHNPAYKNHTILIVKNILDLNTDLMMNFVKNGGSLVVCAEEFDYNVVQSWNINVVQHYYYGPHPIKDLFIHVRYSKDDTYPARNYIVSAPIGNSYFYQYARDDYQTDDEEEDSIKKYNLKWTDKVLLGGQAEMPMVQTTKYGKGTIVICSMPLLFTNYGILENDNYNLIMRIISLAGNKPVVRTRKTITPPKENGSIENDKDSKLKHIISNTPLRTAFNLMLLGFLLFCIFAAKRKQRVIPVIKPRQNGQLGFIKQIGSLHKRKNATDHIIETKYRILTENVKRKAGVDISDPDKRTEAVHRITALAGIEEQEVEQTLNILDKYFQKRRQDLETIREKVMMEKGDLPWSEDIIEMKVSQKLPHTSQKRMVQLIDLMNKIDKKL